jgi:hypothetical protein
MGQPIFQAEDVPAKCEQNKNKPQIAGGSRHAESIVTKSWRQGLE